MTVPRLGDHVVTPTGQRGRIVGFGPTEARVSLGQLGERDYPYAHLRKCPAQPVPDLPPEEPAPDPLW